VAAQRSRIDSSETQARNRVIPRKVAQIAIFAAAVLCNCRIFAASTREKSGKPRLIRPALLLPAIAVVMLPADAVRQ
jgi:hypothetical protein